MNPELRVNVQQNLNKVRTQISNSCLQCSRNPAEITLIAVSKTFTVDHILAAYEIGHRDFGESRVQEALPKIEALPKDIVWHYIGKLQSNKLKKAWENFNIFHTMYSPSQLTELMKVQGVKDVLIEVNIAEEVQKSGIFLDPLDEFIQSIVLCNTVRLRGLMTIGPNLENAEAMRPYFRKLRELGKKIGDDCWLSMGMSGDFSVAIEEGATHIRVGSAIFGSR